MVLLLTLEAYLFSFGWLIHDIPRLRLPIQDLQMRAVAEKAAFFRTFCLLSAVPLS